MDLINVGFLCSRKKELYMFSKNSKHLNHVKHLFLFCRKMNTFIRISKRWKTHPKFEREGKEKIEMGWGINQIYDKS